MGRPVPRARYVARGGRSGVERIRVMSAQKREATGVAAAAGSACPEALLDTLLDTLRDNVVRDLAWLLLSAGLLRAQPPIGALASAFETPPELLATVDW